MKATDWSKQTTLMIRFADVPTGSQFAYASSGAIRVSRNVFTKVEPFTASAPNATSAESSRLKLWFEPEALVRIVRPSWLTQNDIKTVEEAREAAYQAEKRVPANKRYTRSGKYSVERCNNCSALSGDHDMRVCGGKSADRAEARITATLLLHAEVSAC